MDIAMLWQMVSFNLAVMRPHLRLIAGILCFMFDGAQASSTIIVPLLPRESSPSSESDFGAAVFGLDAGPSANRNGLVTLPFRLVNNVY